MSLVPAHRLSNRSLEFLGDSILNFVAASYLFQRKPAYPEGKLTMTRSCLVNNEVLAKICVEKLKLHRCLLVANFVTEYATARNVCIILFDKNLEFDYSQSLLLLVVLSIYISI